MELGDVYKLKQAFNSSFRFVELKMYCALLAFLPNFLWYWRSRVQSKKLLEIQTVTYKIYKWDIFNSALFFFTMKWLFFFQAETKYFVFDQIQFLSHLKCLIYLRIYLGGCHKQLRRLRAQRSYNVERSNIRVKMTVSVRVAFVPTEESLLSP